MDLTTLVIIVAAIVALILFKSAGQIGAQRAVKYLKEGAAIVDVRTTGEYEAGHLEGVLHIPLGDLSTTAPAQLPDKHRVLLVHCASGGRSLIAARKLRSLGYPNAYNLGSLGRARDIQSRSRL